PHRKRYPEHRGALAEEYRRRLRLPPECRVTAAKKQRPRTHLRVIEGEKNTSPSRDTFFELLFQEANDGILLVDRDSGKVVSANRRLQELTGYPRAELEGTEVSKLFPSPE